MSEPICKQVVAIQTASCTIGGTANTPPPGVRQHVSGFRCDDGTEYDAAAAIDLIKLGAVFHMKPSPGAPAFDAHAATGLNLIVQVRTCPLCEKEILFA